MIRTKPGSSPPTRTCWSADRGPSADRASLPSMRFSGAAARRCMGEFLRVALSVAGKDLRVEQRSKTALISALAFAALVLVIFNFARDAAAVSREALAPSVLWITFSFSGVIALN